MIIMKNYGKVMNVFKMLSLKEQLRLERERNIELLNRQIEIENALLEVAEITANNEIALKEANNV